MPLSLTLLLAISRFSPFTIEGNVSVRVNSATKKTNKQLAAIIKDGKANGKVSKIVPLNIFGNDLAGEERNPPITGPMDLPNPPITPKRAIPLAEFESSQISARYVFATPILPFNSPHINREATAIVNVGEKPKSIDDIAEYFYTKRVKVIVHLLLMKLNLPVPNNPHSNAGLRPKRSETVPQIRLPNKLPALNAEPSIPARYPNSVFDR